MKLHRTLALLAAAFPAVAGDTATPATTQAKPVKANYELAARWTATKVGKLVFDLVDEVWDNGDTLVVKNRGQEQRIALSDIKNVSYSPFINPPRVTLSLRRPTVFGDQITFSAPVRLVPFSTSPVINDLIERVDRARGKHD